MKIMRLFPSTAEVRQQMTLDRPGVKVWRKEEAGESVAETHNGSLDVCTLAEWISSETVEGLFNELRWELTLEHGKAL